MGQPDRRGLTALTARVAAVLSDPPVGLRPHARVLAAVSGGPDSVAMVHLLRAARPDLDVVVGHVRHGLRDDAADAAAARANADLLGLGYLERSVAVGEGRGPEDAARRARHDALADLCRTTGALAYLLAHTADDQAETVLLRIARGTGIPGLAGMDVVTERDGLRLIRPLLAERRADVHLAAVGHPHVTDPTNADPDQRRARARFEVLPALARLHPDEGDVVPLLVRLAEHARPHRHCSATSLRLEGGRPEQLVHWVSRFGQAVDVHLLGASALARYGDLLQLAWHRLPDPPRWPGQAASARLQALGPGDSVELPGGVRATRLPAPTELPPGAPPPPGLPGSTSATGDRLVLRHVRDRALPRVVLELDRAVQVPGFGTLTAELLGAHPSGSLPAEAFPAEAVPAGAVPADAVPAGRDAGRATGPPGSGRAAPDRRTWQAWSWTVEVAADSLPLAVRGRRPEGDRAARRVLQTFPEPLRGQVPLVVDAHDRVLMAGPVVLAPPAVDAPRVRLTAIAPREGQRVGYPPPP